MIGCAVSADLARYEREVDRAEEMADFADRLHHEHGDALAKRLMRCKGWISEALESDDVLANLTLAASYSADYHGPEADCALRNTFWPLAKEKAGELLQEAIDDYFDRYERQRPRRGWSYECEPPSPPDAESVDLSEYE
jgi:hypothetical protein